MRSKYFKINELVSPDILAVLTDDLAWRLIPDWIITSLDSIREAYNAPIYINGLGLVNCGIRAKGCPVGASNSKHKHGFAFDLHATDLPKLRSIIQSKFREFRICRMEHPDYTAGWCHVEFCATEPINLTVFIP